MVPRQRNTANAFATASGLAKRSVVFPPAQCSKAASATNPGVIADPGQDSLLQEALSANPVPILVAASTCLAHPNLLSRIWESAQAKSREKLLQEPLARLNT